MILLWIALLLSHQMNVAWVPSFLSSYFYSVNINPNTLTQREEKVHNFEFGENGVLEIDHSIGNVYITAGPSGSITIKVIKSAEPNHLDDLKTEISADAHKVTLITKAQTNIVRATINCQITAPASTTIIKNKVSMGQTWIEDIKGAVTTSARDGVFIKHALGLVKAYSSMGKVFITTQGSIETRGRDGVIIRHLPNAQGTIQAESSMGAVEIADAQGSIEKANGRDGVRIENARESVNAFSSMGIVFVAGTDSINASGRDGVVIRHLPNARGTIKARSSMGKVEIINAQGPIEKANGRDGVTIVNPQDDVTATTSMGAIELQLDGSITNAEIEAKTSMGTIASSIPLTIIESSPKKVKGIIGCVKDQFHRMQLSARDNIRISQKK